MTIVRVDSQRVFDDTRVRLTKVVQTHLDVTARAKGYDSALSCVSYMDSTIPAYRTEAAAMRDWRDAVWVRCYGLLAEVRSNAGPIPSEEDVLNALPKINW